VQATDEFEQDVKFGRSQYSRLLLQSTCPEGEVDAGKVVALFSHDLSEIGKP